MTPEVSAYQFALKVALGLVEEIHASFDLGLAILQSRTAELQVLDAVLTVMSRAEGALAFGLSPLELREKHFDALGGALDARGDHQWDWRRPPFSAQRYSSEELEIRERATRWIGRIRC